VIDRAHQNVIVGEVDYHSAASTLYPQAEQDGRVQFNLEYWEPGIGFVGTAIYDGDVYTEDYVDCNQDEVEYKRIASETWGYEEYEEPEPLTEWYKDGVEAKGLE
jgi:hypothetical protein